jgi:hypothetical protein
MIDKSNFMAIGIDTTNSLIIGKLRDSYKAVRGEAYPILFKIRVKYNTTGLIEDSIFNNYIIDIPEEELDRVRVASLRVFDTIERLLDDYEFVYLKTLVELERLIVYDSELYNFQNIDAFRDFIDSITQEHNLRKRSDNPLVHTCIPLVTDNFIKLLYEVFSNILKGLGISATVSYDMFKQFSGLFINDTVRSNLFKMDNKLIDYFDQRPFIVMNFNRIMKNLLPRIRMRGLWSENIVLTSYMDQNNQMDYRYDSSVEGPEENPSHMFMNNIIIHDNFLNKFVNLMINTTNRILINNTVYSNTHYEIANSDIEFNRYIIYDIKNEKNERVIINNITEHIDIINHISNDNEIKIIRCLNNLETIQLVDEEGQIMNTANINIVTNVFDELLPGIFITFYKTGHLDIIIHNPLVLRCSTNMYKAVSKEISSKPFELRINMSDNLGRKTSLHIILEDEQYYYTPLKYSGLFHYKTNQSNNWLRHNLSKEIEFYINNGTKHRLYNINSIWNTIQETNIVMGENHFHSLKKYEPDNTNTYILGIRTSSADDHISYDGFPHKRMPFPGDANEYHNFQYTLFNVIDETIASNISIITSNDKRFGRLSIATSNELMNNKRQAIKKKREIPYILAINIMNKKEEFDILSDLLNVNFKLK